MHAMRHGPVLLPTLLTALSACAVAPAVVPATESPPANPSEAVAEFVALADAARRDAGCGTPLEWHDGIADLARAHSEDMARHAYFDHVDRSGRTPMQRVQAADIPVRAVAENIARGQRTGADVFRSWRGSPGHSRNLLNCEYTHHGVGLSGGYWTHVLVRPG
jgi:uncharacterized protein YkwD